MPEVPIVMPQLGESIAEAIIVSFLVKPGDFVTADQPIIEVETNKATMQVTAPCSGKIVEFKAKENESYPVGAILGTILVSEEEATKLGLTTKHPQPIGTAGKPGAIPHKSIEEKPRVQPTVTGLPVPANLAGASYMSPRMKARLNELGLRAADLAGIQGTGAGGRVTIQDLERFLAQIEKHKTTPASPLRIAVADAMRRSWTRPIAMVAMPVQLDKMLEHRKNFPEKPGPALYVVRALALALAEDSTPAGRLIGNKIVHPQSIDIAVAVEVSDGVMVPVIRNADKKPLRDLIGPYRELVSLARGKKLPPEMTGGSIATVTNYGVFGLTFGTPIPLPEQTLVLGLGAAQKVPHWDESLGQFIPITQAYLTLSFDHRVLDGGGAGRLLGRVAYLLNHPELL